MKLRYKDLKYGELYRTTKKVDYSDFENGFARVTVPSKEKLLFRSFQKYGSYKDKQLALFFWLEKRITVCLVVSDKTPILYLSHLDWDKRNEIEDVEA